MDIRRSPRVPVTSAQQAIPYNPKRITPAGSVLIPMSAEEMEKMRLFRGRGTERLMASRKRERSPATHEEGEPPTKKLSARDVEVVVQHYNSRPEVGIAQRGESPIIGLKSFNNWIKSVIISKFAHPAFNRKPEVPKSQGVGKVLDMGCGKGGDMTKWGKARIKLYVGADIASVSVEQARQRWQTMRGHRFDAKFAAVDCYTQSLATVFPSEVLVPPFDVVSMQFCMHYAFETETKARCMLQNVTQWLRPGGVFIGTIPNADLLLDRLDELPPGSDDYTFGNSVYRIRFESRDYRPIYGHKYWFYLKDAVDDVPEYVVDWDEFCELAEEYGLRLTYKKTFHEVYSENEEHPEFGPLLVRMKVVGTNGACAIDDEQWEAANIYIAFAFEKKA
ncbi:guanine-N(7)-methyltransferase [Fistulina hepatica ATCC 64428]|nr:guanine-N(7)-methyltransferase [Fistulina hepatica ATCC 64428]